MFCYNNENLKCIVLCRLSLSSIDMCVIVNVRRYGCAEARYLLIYELRKSYRCVNNI